MSEPFFQGKIVEELTEMVERAEHRAVIQMPRRFSSDFAVLVPSVKDEDSYLLGAA
jgi:hypothetical protein